MRKALITGAAGFCAGHLAQTLIQETDVLVIGCDISPNPFALKSFHEYSCLDIVDTKRMEELIHKQKPDIIFHLAGLRSGNPIHIYQVNVLGCMNVLEAIKKHAPQARLIVVGSAAEYGDIPTGKMPLTEDQECHPSGPYGLSKYFATLAALDYARTMKIRCAVVRPFNIIGAAIPPSCVIGAILARAKEEILKSPISTLAENKELWIRVGNVDTERDFIAVEDVIQAYIKLAESDCWGEIFNICTGIPRSIRSVVQDLLSNSPQRIFLRVDPDLMRPDDVSTSYGSYEKAHKAFGFKPKVSLSLALKKAWDYAMGDGTPCV